MGLNLEDCFLYLSCLNKIFFKSGIERKTELTLYRNESCFALGCYFHFRKMNFIVFSCVMCITSKAIIYLVKNNCSGFGVFLIKYSFFV